MSGPALRATRRCGDPVFKPIGSKVGAQWCGAPPLGRLAVAATRSLGRLAAGCAVVRGSALGADLPSSRFCL